MFIDLNSATVGFLADHVVEGTPLLPTVMAVDAMVGVVAPTAGTDEVITLDDVRIGPPVLVPAGRTTTVDVHSDSAATVRLRTGHVDHFSARVAVAPAPRSIGAAPSARDAQLTITSAHVYPPYFHGPTFRVIAVAGLGNGEVHALYAADLPALAWPDRATVVHPRLLELCLQTCGLWELTHSGRLMIPQAIERVRVRAETVEPVRVPVRAVARVREDGRFDAWAVDGNGRTVVRVEGYRTVDRGLDADPVQVEGIRNAIDATEISNLDAIEATR